MALRTVTLLLASGLLLIASPPQLARGQNETDVVALRRAAEERNAAAQRDLCKRYYRGQGVPQDHAKAAKWCRAAADQGNAVAQLNLGRFYHTGKGVPQSANEGTEWYRKAAEQGLAEAQLAIGLMYATGRGVPKDQEEAARWFGRAAAQGNVKARELLQRIASSSPEVPRDEELSEDLRRTQDDMVSLIKEKVLARNSYRDDGYAAALEVFTSVGFTDAKAKQALGWLDIFQETEEANGLRRAIETLKAEDAEYLESLDDGRRRLEEHRRRERFRRLRWLVVTLIVIVIGTIVGIRRRVLRGAKQPEAQSAGDRPAP